MSHIKKLFFDEITRPAVFLAAPPVPRGMGSAWVEREGVQLLCYFERTPAGPGLRDPMTGAELEPAAPAGVAVVRVYVRDVNIAPLLPHDMLAGIEYEIMGDDA